MPTRGISFATCVAGPCVSSSSPWPLLMTFGRFTVQQNAIKNLETAQKTRRRRFVSASPFFVFFSHKGALVGECQIAVISNTDNHVTPRPFSALVRVSLRLSAGLLSQVRGSSCRCHMMSCGPVVGAEQWQFYPHRAIWSTHCSLSHARTPPSSSLCATWVTMS